MLILIKMTSKKIILIILDGWGISEDKKHNAIAQADTPNFNYLWNNFPHARLEASGRAVGLPEGQMGNSEVGHMNIGAGRVVYQDLEKINKAIEENLLEKNPALESAFNKAKKYNSTIHIKGLVSDGGVHSHIKHLHALLDLAKKAGVSKVFIHAFTDGRDTPPQSAQGYIEDLEKMCKETGIGCIASISGRYYAMDRDNNWERTQCAFDAIAKGQGEKFSSPLEAIKSHYNRGVTDEFIKPCVFPVAEGKVCEIMDHDVVIFFNFRADRARQLAKKFETDCPAGDISYITMTKYEDSLPYSAVFGNDSIEENLAEVLSKNNKKQFHIAETEKYSHVTYFFNGGKEKCYPGEDRCLIPSNKVATHDIMPEMKAKEIADRVIEEINKKEKDFVLVNFANPDMVGHSGKINETLKAVEAADKAVGEVVAAALKNGYTAVITADHGNAEKMFDEDTGKPHTAHTENLVPFIITDKNLKLKENGKLADVAPTILHVMSIKKPKSMTGESLLA